jgi:hypothetical protein
MQESLVFPIVAKNSGGAPFAFFAIMMVIQFFPGSKVTPAGLCFLVLIPHRGITSYLLKWDQMFRLNQHAAP